MGLTLQLRRHVVRHYSRLLLPPPPSLLPPLSSPSHTTSLLPAIPTANPASFRARPSSSRSYTWFSGSGAPAGTGNTSSLCSDSESEFSSGLGSDAGTEPLDPEAQPEIAEEVVGDGSWWDLPVHVVIGLLDSCHDVSGLPWWIIISASTLSLRLLLLPVLVLQLKKAARIAELLPKLPPPLPPPLSGRGFREQYMLFRQKRQELGCPSFLWNFAFFTAQFPSFLLWMTSIRSMCLSNHSGFDTGGTLWFQNLTDFPHGNLGFIFPIAIAGLHYVNVQISFQAVQLENLRGILGMLAKYYKLYLDILAIPLLLIGFHIPQGSLVYWVTNSFFTLFQQLSFRNSHIRNKLGLPEVKVQTKKTTSSKEDPLDHGFIEKELSSVDSLPPERLLQLALGAMAAGDEDRALPLLRIATEKDPDLVRALVAMGQILCSKSLFSEASEYFERAIPKIQEQDALLVLACFGAGVSHIWQGNKQEGIKRLKRIAELREPNEPMDKACYYKGLVMLGSTLFNEGNKSEAAKYLRIAATYDPAVDAYVKECEETEAQQN